MFLVWTERDLSFFSSRQKFFISNDEMKKWKNSLGQRLMCFVKLEFSRKCQKFFWEIILLAVLEHILVDCQVTYAVFHLNVASLAY